MSGLLAVNGCGPFEIACHLSTLTCKVESSDSWKSRGFQWKIARGIRVFGRLRGFRLLLEIGERGGADSVGESLIPLRRV